MDSTAKFELPGAVVVNLGSVEGIAKGQGRCFIVNDQEIAVFRQRDGKNIRDSKSLPAPARTVERRHHWKWKSGLSASRS